MFPSHTPSYPGPSSTGLRQHYSAIPPFPNFFCCAGIIIFLVVIPSLIYCIWHQGPSSFGGRSHQPPQPTRAPGHAASNPRHSGPRLRPKVPVTGSSPTASWELSVADPPKTNLAHLPRQMPNQILGLGNRPALPCEGRRWVCPGSCKGSLSDRISAHLPSRAFASVAEPLQMTDQAHQPSGGSCPIGQETFLTCPLEFSPGQVI